MPSVTVVNHHKARVVVSRVEPKAKGGVAEFQFAIGANIIDEVELELFAQNPMLDKYFASGLFEIKAAVEPVLDDMPKYGGDLAKLKPKAALRAIAGCQSKRQLLTWLDQDGRPEVREACIARGVELTNAEAPKES